MPAWQQVLELAFDYAEDIWAKVAAGLLLAAVGWWLGKRRASKQWEKKEFLDRLNVSLTFIDDGTLKIRTLLEKPSSEVFLNANAVAAVRSAADSTTEQDPIVPLPEEDRWFYLNAVLNEVAEHFAAGVLRRDVGHAVKCRWYLVCLTNEQAGAVRTRKVRAMIVAESLLTKLPKDPPKFESPNHSTRWETLQILSASYAKDSSQFLRIELCQ